MYTASIQYLSGSWFLVWCITGTSIGGSIQLTNCPRRKRHTLAELIEYHQSGFITDRELDRLAVECA